MRILIVDEQPLFREALGIHLEAMYPEATVFEANSVAEAQGVLSMYARFALIILDASVPGLKGLEWLTILRKTSPDSKIVIISCLADPAVAKELLQQGASGYIAKTAGAGDVRNAIHLVLAGEVYLSPSLLIDKSGEFSSPAVRLPAPAATHLLTPRQREVMSLMAEGLPNKAIAERLQCSDGTVKLHVSAIFRALGARNRTEAVQAAGRLELV
jgi:DNA-binding NarL/FixJ family response regulator